MKMKNMKNKFATISGNQKNIAAKGVILRLLNL